MLVAPSGMDAAKVERLAGAVALGRDLINTPANDMGPEALEAAVRALAGRHHAVLLANHGPVVAGSSLANAQYATEELEETAKLFLMLRAQPIRPLTPEQVDDLRRRYNLY